MPHENEAPLPPEAIPLLRELVDSLVAERYEHMAENGNLGRVTEPDLRRTLAQMNEGTLIDLPSEVWDTLPDRCAFRYYGNDADEWVVDIPLWTREFGESELTLTVSVVRLSSALKVRILDLHIL